jgi:hypothetical protein
MMVACAVATRVLRRARAISIAGIAFGLSRILVIAPATLLNKGRNDERTVAHILNLFPPVVWIAEALVAAAAVAFVARDDAIPRGIRSVIAIAEGLVAGWLSALTIGRAIGLPI